RRRAGGDGGARARPRLDLHAPPVPSDRAARQPRGNAPRHPRAARARVREGVGRLRLQAGARGVPGGGSGQPAPDRRGGRDGGRRGRTGRHPGAGRAAATLSARGASRGTLQPVRHGRGRPVPAGGPMLIRQIVDDKLAQNAYLIGCQRTGEALVVDPERDVDRYLEAAAAEGLHVVAVAETHIHADFLSGARELAARLPGLRVYLSGEGGDDWRYTWPDEDGVAVTLLRDGDSFTVGRITIRAWHTPGHTPEHIAFVVTDEGSGAT